MSIYLKNAIKAEQSFSGLLQIAKQLDAKISFWGTRYVVIEPKNGEIPLNYIGAAPLDFLLTRVLELIETSGRHSSIPKNFSSSEYKECLLLENEINRFYRTDKKNLENSGVITKIFVTFWNVFFDYQYAWYDNIWGRGGQILYRDNYDIISGKKSKMITGKNI